MVFTQGFHSFISYQLNLGFSIVIWYTYLTAGIFKLRACTQKLFKWQPQNLFKTCMVHPWQCSFTQYNFKKCC